MKIIKTKVTINKINYYDVFICQVSVDTTKTTLSVFISDREFLNMVYLVRKERTDDAKLVIKVINEDMTIEQFRIDKIMNDETGMNMSMLVFSYK